MLDHALERDPTNRTASAEQFAQQLRVAIGEPTTRESESTLEQTRASAAPDFLTHTPREHGTHARRNRMAVIAAGVLVVTLGAAYVGRGMFLNSPKAETTPLAGAGVSNDSLRQRAPSTDSGTAALLASAGNNNVGASTLTSRAGDTTAAPAKPVVRPTPQSPTAANGAPAVANRTPPTAHRIELTADRATAIIDGQRDRLLEPPDPAPVVMRAMRDSVLAIFDLPSVAEPDRTRAANLVVSLSYSLRDKALCIKWATLATELNPQLFPIDHRFKH